jgi:Flp pilus assembly protein TadG
MILQRLNAGMARFRIDQGGNVALIFALSCAPMILLVGASVDYTRAVSKKSGLQQATDATVLAVSHYLTQNLSAATLQTDTQNYFAGAVGDANASIVSGPTVSPDNTQVCLTTKSIVPTTIISAASGLGLTATKQLTVGAKSCSKISNITYEIAMVLDNSGSMLESTSGTSKIQSLQTAATQMVSILNPSGQIPKASFSLVSFSLAVNVGSGYRGASWIDNNGKSSIAFQNYLLPKSLPSGSFLPASRFALLDAMGASWGGCVEERPGSYLTSDAPASSTDPDSLFEPYLYPDEYSPSGNTSLINNYGYTIANTYLANESGGTCSSSPLYAAADAKRSTTPVSNAVGNSYLPRGDSQTMVCKYNKQTPRQISFSGQNSGFVTGPNLLCDSQPLTTLTNSNSVLNAQIAAMRAKGSTNLLSGVMWGWRTISPNGPFNTQTTAAGSIGPQNALAYTAKNNVKVMVLMTDGYNSWNANSSSYDNNLSSYSAFGYFENGRLGSTNSSNVRSVMDAATLTACQNAKAAGIQIYTVGFSIPSDPIDSAGLSLLQSCASQTSMAYIAQDGSGLIATFKSIAESMSDLRLVN